MDSHIFIHSCMYEGMYISLYVFACMHVRMYASMNVHTHTLCLFVEYVCIRMFVCL